MTRSKGRDDPLRDPQIISAQLLRWYDQHKRDLPWRQTADPWAILISEIMLQQTTVAAVVPYYERFLKRWPTAAHLAEAERDELLAEWAGLGYYGRAHRLQAAALVVSESGGSLPPTRDELLNLPGVGAYTAGAVASIAFGEAVAAIDGNVERVICRWLALETDPRRSQARRQLTTLVESWLAKDRPGDSNQALIELGATVCRPKSPQCGDCPLAQDCRARITENPERYPRLPPRRATVQVTMVAAVVERNGRWLMSHRESPPNQGFAELPTLEIPGSRCDSDGRPLDGPGDWQEHMGTTHNLAFESGEPLAVHRHTITHHRIAVYPFHARLNAGRLSGPLFWCDREHSGPPLTTATKRMLSAAYPDNRNTPPPRHP